MIKKHVEKHKFKPQSKLDYKMMSFVFAIRDRFKKPIEILKKIGIKEADDVLDYGCGPGSYTIAAAKLTGPFGKVYAVDVNPLAISSIRKKSLKKGNQNVETIQTNCDTRINNNSIDIIYCFDTFHALIDPETNLKEFHRILKNPGKLFITDHHLSEGELLSHITKYDLFKFSHKIDEIYCLVKKIPSGH